jgi:hypothetical protein
MGLSSNQCTTLYRPFLIPIRGSTVPARCVWHYCVKIHASPQLLAKFKTLSKGRTLPQDNATRWGSWFKLIERGLHLQKAVNQFYDIWLDGDDEGKLLQED